MKLKTEWQITIVY